MAAAASTTNAAQTDDRQRSPKDSTKCPDCGNSHLVRAEGCVHCAVCGWSACSAA